MPIDANRAYLLRRSIGETSRCRGAVLTLGVKALEGDESVFSELGYDGIESVDISDFEGCTHVVDLNEPIPISLKNKYGLVYNGGTLEHIFDVRAVLHNIHDFLKPDGIVVHVGPMNGWVEHGFYQFSPTFFSDYYLANKYDALPAYMLKALSDDHSELEIRPYFPGQLNGYAGGFQGVWNFFMAFAKRSSSTWDVAPQQSYYARIYGNGAQACPARRSIDGESFLLKRGKFFPLSAQQDQKPLNSVAGASREEPSTSNR